MRLGKHFRDYFQASSHIYWQILIPIIAVVFALIIGAVLIELSGVSFVKAYSTMFRGAFGSANNLAETLVKATPLLLAGLGTAIAFRTKVFNIGAEGQLYMGALGATYVGLFLGDLPLVIGVPLTLLVGFIMGSIWAGIAALLKLKFRASEIIVTLMMNYLAVEFANYLISGPWRDPSSTEPFTAAIAVGARLPVMLSGTRLHFGFLVAIASALILWWVIRSTVFGYRLTVTGANDKAAVYSGIKTGRIILLTMLISGGLAGLAGVSEVAGVHHRMLEGLSPGYGYTAIAIAMLGRQEPLGVMVASILFSVLVVGADGMQRTTGVPVAVVLIIEGLVLLFVLASELFRQRIALAFWQAKE